MGGGGGQWRGVRGPLARRKQQCKRKPERGRLQALISDQNKSEDEKKNPSVLPIPTTFVLGLDLWSPRPLPGSLHLQYSVDILKPCRCFLMERERERESNDWVPVTIRRIPAPNACEAFHYHSCRCTTEPHRHQTPPFFCSPASEASGKRAASKGRPSFHAAPLFTLLSRKSGLAGAETPIPSFAAFQMLNDGGASRLNPGETSAILDPPIMLQFPAGAGLGRWLTRSGLSSRPQGSWTTDSMAGVVQCRIRVDKTGTSI